MNSDCSILASIRKVTDLRGRSFRPIFNPDTNDIVFTSRLEKSCDLWSVKPDGTGLLRLTQNGHSSDPAVSNDGKYIAYVVEDSQIHDSHRIFKMDAHGETHVELTTGHSDYDPTWSHNDELIAFTSGTTGNLEVFVMKPDGSNQFCLTQSLNEDKVLGKNSRPIFDHKGTGVIFQFTPVRIPQIIGAPKYRQVHAIRFDGSGRRTLVSLDGDCYNFIPFVNDGRILFNHVPKGHKDPCIGIVDELENKIMLLPSHNGTWFTIHPNGLAVLAVSNCGGPNDYLSANEISVISTETGEVRSTMRYDGRVNAPSFSSDGSLVAFSAFENGAEEIFVATYAWSSGK